LVTVDIVDIKNLKKSLDESNLFLQGESNEQDYEINIELYGSVNTKQSKFLKKDRQIIILLKKKVDGIW
jgi:hypothetical protein